MSKEIKIAGSISFGGNLFTQKRLYGQKPIRRNSEYDSHKY